MLPALFWGYVWPQHSVDWRSASPPTIFFTVILVFPNWWLYVPVGILITLHFSVLFLFEVSIQWQCMTAVFSSQLASPSFVDPNLWHVFQKDRWRADSQKYHVPIKTRERAVWPVLLGGVVKISYYLIAIQNVWLGFVTVIAKYA